MAPAKALAQLALQKRLLLAESEAQRLVLASQLHRALTPVRWLDRLQMQSRPLLVVGAPLAGFWVARRTKGMKRWVTAALGAVRLAHSARRLLHKSGAR